MSDVAQEPHPLLLKPLEGVGQIRFGMPTLAVERLLGDPDVRDTRAVEDPTVFENAPMCLSRQWQYTVLGLVFSFTAYEASRFDLRLSRIEATNKKSIIWGIQPIGLTERALVQWLPQIPVTDLALKSDIRSLDPGNPEFDMCEYYSKSAHVSLWIERDSVVSVTMWPSWLPNEFDVSESGPALDLDVL